MRSPKKSWRKSLGGYTPGCFVYCVLLGTWPGHAAKKTLESYINGAWVDIRLKVGVTRNGQTTLRNVKWLESVLYVLMKTTCLNLSFVSLPNHDTFCFLTGCRQTVASWFKSWEACSLPFPLYTVYMSSFYWAHHIKKAWSEHDYWNPNPPYETKILQFERDTWLEFLMNWFQHCWKCLISDFMRTILSPFCFLHKCLLGHFIITKWMLIRKHPTHESKLLMAKVLPYE